MENNNPLTLIHIDVVVNDMERAIAFYKDGLDFKIVEDVILDTDAALFLSGGAARKMRLVFLSRNKRSTMLELIQFLDDQGKGLLLSSTQKLDVSLSFLVSDLDELKASLKAKGQLPLSEEFEIALPQLGRTKIVFYRDPDDYLIEFVAPSQP